MEFPFAEENQKAEMLFDGEPVTVRPMPPSDVPPSLSQDKSQLNDLMEMTANIPRSVPTGRAKLTSASASFDTGFSQSQKSPPKPAPAPTQLAEPSRTEIPSPRRHAPSPPKSPDRIPPAEEYQRDHSPDKRQMPEPSFNDFGGAGGEDQHNIEDQLGPAPRPPLTRTRKNYLIARAAYFRKKGYHNETFDPSSTNWEHVETLIEQCDERQGQENALKNTKDMFSVVTKLLQRGVLEMYNPRVPDYAQIDLDHGPNGEESWYEMMHIATHEEGRFDDVLLQIHERYLKDAIKNPLAQLGVVMAASMVSFSQQRSEDRRLAAAAKQEEHEYHQQQRQAQPAAPVQTAPSSSYVQQTSRPAPAAPKYPVVNESELRHMVERAQENAVPGVQINSDFNNFLQQQEQAAAVLNQPAQPPAQPEPSPEPVRRKPRGGRRSTTNRSTAANSGKDEVVI